MGAQYLGRRGKKVGERGRGEGKRKSGEGLEGEGEENKDLPFDGVKSNQKIKLGEEREGREV